MKPIRLDSGIKLLNLGSSGRLDTFLKGGQYLHLVGDSETGKSWLASQILAEASENPEFKDHVLYYDDVENGNDFIEKYFPKLAKRVVMASSATLEESFDAIDDLVKSGKPFIAFQDSNDSLDTEDDDEKIEEQKKARRKGNKTTGSYGTAKAKINSLRLRKIVPKLKHTNSILGVVSQTRDNLGMGFDKKTRSGGKALHFYAHLSVWCTPIKGLTTKVNDKTHKVGSSVQFEFKKNRLTGRHVKIVADYKYNYGFDDTMACVQFLIDEKHWKKSNGVINAKELGIQEKESKIGKVIEQKGKLPALHKVVKTVWKGIEAQLQIDRKPRYI